MVKCWQFLIELNSVCHFMSTERPGQRASSSELKRWCQNNAVILNGRAVNWDHEIEFPVTSLVLFPKRPRTIW